MTSLDVSISDVTLDYGGNRALNSVTTRFRPGVITGLLGRNGSGKTTLLSLVGSFRRPTSGRITVAGVEPFENERISEQVCLIRESGDVMGTETIETNFDYLSRMRPTWDDDFAEHLISAFGLDPATKVDELSRGQASAVGAIVGLASRAPITIFDEVHLGMDAAVRQRFYDELLMDYAERPRTYVISSHLISEIETILEHVVVLRGGSVVTDEETESLRDRGFTIIGPSPQVAKLTRDVRVLRTRALGPTTEATVLADGRSGQIRAQAAAEGLEIGAVSIQDLVIHMTEEASS